MSTKAYYHSPISQFLTLSTEEIRGVITNSHTQVIEYSQTRAWMGQVENLQEQLKKFPTGYVCFELLIPRMGRRADVVLLYKGIVFVLEYKVGAKTYGSADKRQALGYALDLKHFHSESHERVIIPILIATKAKPSIYEIVEGEANVTEVICSNGENLQEIIIQCSQYFDPEIPIDATGWLAGPYRPTPTIIEAAKALYANHDVKDISRSDAGAINLAKTSEQLQEIITSSRLNKQKTICFVTGVPGAGKTLVGLNIATSHSNGDDDFAVFLSGNGPLVAVLQEALAQDNNKRNNVKMEAARREAKAAIQNIHHFRDDALKSSNAPIENVVIFDEAQRAWDLRATQRFMETKRQQSFWNQSEPEFLISIMDRHPDWCVIIALIGGGQEINRGEAGLRGWVDALSQSFSDWNIFYSIELKQQEYAGSVNDLDFPKGLARVKSLKNLHLSTSMRSFRAEKLSHFVHHLIGNKPARARLIALELRAKYPLFVTRNLQRGKKWIGQHTRGIERAGLIASSGAKRLKAEGVFVNQEVDPKHWFLNEPDDVRSSNFLEDVASEFVVQGLELDWCLIGWDADYRYNNNLFEHWKFIGSKWQQRNKDEEKQYLENVYRVLLTRARQGLVIYVPHGDTKDETRKPEFYDQTYAYLLSCGMTVLE